MEEGGYESYSNRNGGPLNGGFVGYEHVMKSTLEDLAQLGQHIVIASQGIESSELPLVSFGFYWCSALVMQRGKRMVLSHLYPQRRRGK